MNDDDLRELAYSAHEEAMSFGLSHDTFLRYFKTIRERCAQAVEAAGLADHQRDPHGMHEDRREQIKEACAVVFDWKHPLAERAEQERTVLLPLPGRADFPNADELQAMMDQFYERRGWGKAPSVKPPGVKASDDQGFSR